MEMTHRSPQGSTPNSSKQDELRAEILNNVLVHEPECDSSMYGTACDCVQKNVADNIMKAVLPFATTLAEETEKRLTASACAIAEYWVEEDGRPKHLIQDLWDVAHIERLDHIDQKYLEKYGLAPQKESE